LLFNPALRKHFSVVHPRGHQNFNIVKSFAPVAQVATGLFSTEFKLSGELTKNLLPALGTFTGAGRVNILEAGTLGPFGAVLHLLVESKK
jgi:hypothetical protein